MRFPNYNYSPSPTSLAFRQRSLQFRAATELQTMSSIIVNLVRKERVSVKFILLVDDEPDLLGMMRDILEISGYRVATAYNGREALDYLLNHPLPAVIFLDLTMPIMNGVKFLEAIRSGDYPQLVDIPVVIVSAVEEFLHLERFRCSAILRKPAQLQTFLGMAERFAPK